MNFDLEHIKNNYQLIDIDINNLGEYLNWSTEFFHNSQSCAYPLLSLTFPIEITKLKESFLNSKIEEASFTSFLMWKICHTILKFPDFLLRNINGTWYKLNDPAMYSPVAVGGSKRFRTIFIKSPGSMTWPEYHKEYQRQLKNALTGEGKITVSEEDFHLSTMIGNLPNIQITSFQFHQFPNSTGRQLFYMGKRYQDEDKLMLPFSATIDHGNADPYALDLFIKEFLK